MKKKPPSKIVTFRLSEGDDIEFLKLCEQLGVTRSMMLNLVVQNILSGKIKLTKNELVSFKK